VVQSELQKLRAAQAEAYDLLGRLLARGVTVDLSERVRGWPELDAALRATGGLDLAAAEHYAVFSLGVFPLVSVFLDESGAAGGVVTDRVQADLLAAGAPAPADLPADHAGALLVTLGRLAGAEADALEDGHRDVAARASGLAAGLLERHPLPIWPALAWAVREEAPAGGVSRVSFELAEQLILHHRRSLATQFGLPMTDEPAPEPLAALLARPETGLKDVAAFLLAPARSGAFLSRRRLLEIGRGEAVPGGFGGRDPTLVSLLFGAVDFEALPEVLEGLAAAFEGAARSYAAYDEALPDISAAWRARARSTASALCTMARTGTSQPSDGTDRSSSRGTSKPS